MSAGFEGASKKIARESSESASRSLLIESERISRRAFLKLLGLLGAAFMLPSVRPLRTLAQALTEYGSDLHEALFYEKLSPTTAQCRLCFRNCLVGTGERGECRSRENIDGTLYTLTYGRPVAIHIDPVEKEPLFHFLPGSDTLCEGTATCNFACEHCINWEIALRMPEDVEAIPTTADELVEIAVRESVPTICFTYNEPTQQYEYVLDIVQRAKERGVRTTLHTNGGINPEPLDRLLPYLDSVAIDLKAFDDRFYRDIVHAELMPVLGTLERLAESGAWFEIVNLVIPTLNDSEDTIRQMCEWIVRNLGTAVPIHFSRFFPSHKLTRLPPTPLQTLERAHDIAVGEGIRFAYVGNVSGHRYAHTYCPRCGELLIQRQMFLVSCVGLSDDTCQYCGEPIQGTWR